MTRVFRIVSYKAHEAYQLGVNDFIDKPFTSETIERSLFRLIENRELGR